MQEAWSIIDVLLKKRYELAPRLVEIVEGYNLYEKSQLETITRLRGEAMLEENRETKIKAESLFGRTIDHLFLHTEDYPELKANQLFLKLQIQLTELENELEKARRYYNGTVRENNIMQESFPSNLIAKLFSFSKGVFFQQTPTSGRNPQHHFVTSFPAKRL